MTQLEDDLEASIPGTPAAHRREQAGLAKAAAAMSFAEYQAIDAVNWSTLKSMLESPMQYRHDLAHPRKDTKALREGRALHTALWEPDRFPIEYVVFNGERKGNKWKDFKAANVGASIVTADEYATTLAIRDKVRAHPLVKPYLESGRNEVTNVWTDPTTGLLCKGRLDRLSDAKPAIVDLKRTKRIGSNAFARTAANLGYHIQQAFYRDGWMIAHGEQLPVVFIAAQDAPPHDVAVYRLEEDPLVAGSEEYTRLLQRLLICRQDDHWPGMYETEQSLALPAWIYGSDDDSDDLGLTGWKDEDAAE